MNTHVELRPGAYADSVTLLQVSRSVQQVDDVAAAQVAMATALNLEVLGEMGFEIPETTANDMVVALRFTTDAAPDVLDKALAAVEQALDRRQEDRPTEREPHRTTGLALAEGPRDSLVLVSVPGANATVEAMDALDAGHDVMVFSDNVPVEQELAMKQAAGRSGLLVMGPDCGTAVVDGLGLGFANTTSPGPVGIVAASGTGCQQLLALLDYAGVGVSSALGVGGRDLSAAVGGLSTREAMRRLDADPSVDLVVVVSKPPAREVAEALQAYADTLETPTVFALLGAGQPDLTASAEQVLARLGREVPDWPTTGQATGAAGDLLRGLFVGGTLCDESMLIATDTLGPVRSNIPLSPDLEISDLDAALTSGTHLMIDFGDDALTQGRAHPMIDPTLRLDYLSKVAEDSRTGVVLLDVVLGHGAEADPAALLAPAVADVVRRRIPVVVSLVGTAGDPQGYDRTAAALADAGAEVHLSNAAATRRAVSMLGGGQ